MKVNSLVRIDTLNLDDASGASLIHHNAEPSRLSSLCNSCGKKPACMRRVGCRCDGVCGDCILAKSECSICNVKGALVQHTPLLSFGQSNYRYFFCANEYLNFNFLATTHNEHTIVKLTEESRREFNMHRVPNCTLEESLTFWTAFCREKSEEFNIEGSFRWIFYFIILKIIYSQV